MVRLARKYLFSPHSSQQSHIFTLSRGLFLDVSPIILFNCSLSALSRIHAFSILVRRSFKMTTKKTAKAQLKVSRFFIPADEEEWQELFAESKLKNKTIHTVPAEEIGSGSDVNECQFVLFRAYWRAMLAPRDLRNHLDTYGLAAN
jgi:hypothetical protein